MILLSYIVPVFNSSKYLVKCLDSIINQGLEEDEFEIILIDDGSTDDSLDVCKDYGHKYDNVKVISQKNSGVASARNAGLTQAVGKYVCFVDSDDYLTPYSISNIFKIIGTRSVQLIRFWVIILEENEIQPLNEKGLINFEGGSFEYVAKFGFDTFCVSFLYDRLWLLESNIIFEPFKIAEDYLFISKLLLLDPYVISTSYVAYNYVKHSTSATGNRSPKHAEVCARDLFSVVDALIDYASGLPIDNNIKRLLMQSAQDKMRAFMSRVLSSDISVKEFRLMVGRLRERGILPINNDMGGLKYKFIKIGINFISKYPSLLKPLRFLYIHLFIPLLMPFISKN